VSTVWIVMQMTLAAILTMRPLALLAAPVNVSLHLNVILPLTHAAIWMLPWKTIHAATASASEN